MPSTHAYAVFLPAALVLLAIPGPAVLFIVATSVDEGRRNGMLSVAGVHLGSLVHIAAAVAGLSALIVSSAIAFSAVKYVGAATSSSSGSASCSARTSRSRPRSARPGAAAASSARASSSTC